jgi:amino acid permease
MERETGPNSEADRLRDRLLEQWRPERSSYLAYRKEIETMLEKQEKKLRFARRFTTVLWIYIVVLTTIMLTGSGLLMIHKIEGTWMAVTAVFWFLFGAVFLFGHQINQRSFEVIKEIKGLELRLVALEERLARRGDVAGTAD